MFSPIFYLSTYNYEPLYHQHYDNARGRAGSVPQRYDFVGHWAGLLAAFRGATQ